jgi:hypothetical protein
MMRFFAKQSWVVSRYKVRFRVQAESVRIRQISVIRGLLFEIILILAE